MLGIDYGSRRIGVAVSDPMGIIAQGIGVVDNGPSAIAELARLASSYAVVAIVVGMPFTLRGEMGRKAEEVERFIAELEGATGRKIIRADERFTTKSARATILAMGVKKKGRRDKGAVDRTAAALILQGYLDGASRRPQGEAGV